jgi:hypothetical protein
MHVTKARCVPNAVSKKSGSHFSNARAKDAQSEMMFEYAAALNIVKSRQANE